MSMFTHDLVKRKPKENIHNKAFVPSLFSLHFINSSNQTIHFHIFSAFSVSCTVLQLYFHRQLLYCSFSPFPRCLHWTEGRGDNGAYFGAKCCKVFYLFPLGLLYSHPYYPHGLKNLGETPINSRSCLADHSTHFNSHILSAWCVLELWIESGMG